jgi:molybdenum cofactor synthesis domain-containing protein
MAEYDLLDKRELKIEEITLTGANLTEIAAVVADVIGIDRQDVLVIDVREDVLALDVLRKHVDPHVFAGKKEELLRNLAKIPGVMVSAKTRITSRGMLGWIAADDGVDGAEIRASLDLAQKMAKEILQTVSRRVIVFSSGIEVQTGQIEDTNTPMIANRLEREGFRVTRGDTLKDEEMSFSAKLRDAIDRGFGFIITTGGVGAEDKDCSVEAILRLDPAAATPYLVTFEVGKGRHAKPGIRIGVGEKDGTMLIALPGPNEEVNACLEILANGMKSKTGKEELADALAQELRGRLRKKMGHREGVPGHAIKSFFKVLN